MQVKVLLPIPAGGALFIPGDIVDASSWANLTVLIAQGYARPLTPDELAALAPPPHPAPVPDVAPEPTPEPDPAPVRDLAPTPRTTPRRRR